MRLFLAIYPPAHVKSYIRDVMRKLDKEKRNLKPINIENVHLTAKYFGSRVSEGSRNRIAQELLRHEGSFPLAEVKVTSLQLGFFKQSKPRVLLLNVEADEGLNQFVDEVHRYTRALKLNDVIRWKAKDFNDHHISIARLKDAAMTNSTIRRVKDLISTVNIPLPEPFVVEEVRLVQSTITPRGPVYKNFEQIKL